MTTSPSPGRLSGLLQGEPRVVTAGAAMLADALTSQAATVEQVDWRPPADGSDAALARVMADPRRVAANATAVERLLSAEAQLVDVRPAHEVLGLERGTFLHAGPPIDWERASGPLRGALIGAMLYEERADSPETILKTVDPLRVLVVDDQPILSQLVCEYLREDFHTAETAVSADEALEKFRIGQFDLVITDYVMAGMTGEKLAEKIKELSPAVPIILLTGYTMEATGEKQYSGTIDFILRKPLSRVSLRKALAEVMAAA